MRKDFGAKPWLYPQPVLIIGTYNEDGTADAMNAAWGGLYDSNKVVLCLSAGHKTTANIRAQGAFTVSFADEAHVVPCDYVGLVSANNESGKMEKSGLHVTKSAFVEAPLIDELPVALECKLIRINEDGNVIGEIVNVSVMRACWEKMETWIWQNSVRSPLSRYTMHTMYWVKRWATLSVTVRL